MLIDNNGCNSSDKAVKDFSSSVMLFKEYAQLVKSRAYSFISSGCELDDLVQEGNIGLLYASVNYDHRLSSFTTFAQKCIDASIINYLRKLRKLSHIPIDMLVDISDVQVADISGDPEHTADIKDEYSQMVKKAESVLSAFEFAVFSDLLHGYNTDETAERKGVNTKSVHNAVQRIRAKLK